VVAVELWRRGCSLGYGLTSAREEVDFVARGPDGSVFLVQVCADLQDPATCARDLQADRPEASLRSRFNHGGQFPLHETSSHCVALIFAGKTLLSRQG